MADQLLRAGFRFYQSANADAESIKEGFIIRQHEYEIIMEDIRRNSRERSVQHYLLLGRRGSGKSTLLRRIQVEIDTDEKLRKSYIAINLAEEQANIYRLSDLWEEILQELEHAGISVSYPDWEEDADSYSHKLIDAAHTAIHASRKKVVLLLDNIDRIFENLKADAALLREYLLNFDDLKIIGGSTRMTEHFWMYDQPFYEFFRVLNLNLLSSAEVKTLLLFWAEKLNQPELKTFVEMQSGQLETIRILTDGLPRTLQFFVNILLNRTQETGYEYLRLIMDQVTPLYQERLNNLPPAQRKIVLQLAFIWEATGTKELTSAAHMTNSVVSAQLKQLNDKSIVEIVKTDNKNHLYRIAERFFNLWLIFTQGSPYEKRRARYLTIFLENFYNVEDLKRLASSHLEMIRGGRLDANNAALITKALAQSKYITLDARDDLIRHTVALKGLNRELKQQLPLLTDEIFKKIHYAINNKEWEKAIRLTNEIEQDGVRKWYILGYIHQEKGNFLEAEKYYLMAIAQNDTFAMCNLGNIYYDSSKFENAEKYYLMAIDQDNADAIYNLANLYNDQSKFEKAEKYYLMAIEQDEADAMCNLGNLYNHQLRYAEAEKYYLMAIELGHLTSIYNLAELYYLYNTNKQETKQLIDQCLNTYLSKHANFLNTVINLWLGDVELANKSFVNILKTTDFNLDSIPLIEFTLLHFLIHHQTNFIFNLFNDEKFGKELTERYQPVYYAAAIFAERDKNIALKIPPEIKETVDEIINDVKERRQFYYGTQPSS